MAQWVVSGSRFQLRSWSLGHEIEPRMGLSAPQRVCRKVPLCPHLPPSKQNTAEGRRKFALIGTWTCKKSRGNKRRFSGCRSRETYQGTEVRARWELVPGSGASETGGSGTGRGRTGGQTHSCLHPQAETQKCQMSRREEARLGLEWQDTAARTQRRRSFSRKQEKLNF